MTWQEKNKVELRKEFIKLAMQEGTNISQLCKHFGISRKTGYKWLNRFESEDDNTLQDQSRRPLTSPEKTTLQIADKIIDIRQQHPCWGARKIKAVLLRRGVKNIPASSTIHSILVQKGFINPKIKSTSYLNRFEHEAPNHLWQMDFKGNFPYEQGRCYPLTILDDHSRFSICLQACANERGETVKPILIETFKRYGLPERINVDNGNPWGSLFDSARYTTLSIWLIRHGIQVSYSRPGHPQTNGKEERFHRTLKMELLDPFYYRDLAHIQRAFNRWRNIYNVERPHEGINMQVPADRYKVSYRGYNDRLQEFVYSDDYILRKVDVRGRIHFEGRQIFVGMPFAKEIVGIRLVHESNLDLYFCHQRLGGINLKEIPRRIIINLYSGRVTHL